MKKSEMIQMSRLLEKYKEHMCSKYKIHGVSCLHECEECPHSEYEEYNGGYFCTVDDYIEQAEAEANNAK